MPTQQKILLLATQKGKVTVADLAKHFSVSRQYIHRLIQGLVDTGELVKLGKARASFYVPQKETLQHTTTSAPRYTKIFKNIALEEHVILSNIEQTFSLIKKLPENISSLFTFGFSEMLNNAIEHSRSKTISIDISLENKILNFSIKDNGIGVFRNIMQKHKLKSEFEAMQDLLKGKMTTMPKSHSGEGIFFTSKAADLFILDSFGYQLIIDNHLPDVFMHQTNKIIKGTLVTFNLNLASNKQLSDIFSQYTNIGEESDFGFDKTEVRVKLYTLGGVHISRSQARRILVGLEKFNVILFDFDKVPMVGQAFADEIFRVFHDKYPQIQLVPEKMNPNVKFMIERAITEANRR